MGLSYEFSIGSVRAKEKSLFDNSDIEQMLSCKSENELAVLLKDKGYGDGNTVDEIIESHTEKVWEYLRSVAPDFDIFSPFIVQNDIHNLKVVLKGTMSARKYSHLLVNPCTIDTDLIIRAIDNQKFSLLPDWLSKPAEKAYELISHKGDARESDAVIDTAAMKRVLEISEQYNSDFLKQYFNTLVFYSNIKTAIRSSRTKTNKDFLESAFCDVQEFRRNSVINATLKGNDALLDELSRYSEYECNKALEQYKLSPSSFERFVDDKLMKMAKESCKRTSEGAEPIIGYYLGSETEKKVIHIIASGIRTNSNIEIIRERLREIYG
ncbi:MAG: V-type ATPase subunit [Ruminococcus sp.]|nr:V-type ATPase subunit [Ruminococcus sp.]